MRAAGFELFDHTADLGIRAWAPDRPGLVEPLVAGLYAAIGDLAAGPTTGTQSFRITAPPATALRDLLAELLHHVEIDGRRATAVQVDTFDDTTLAVTATWAPIDLEASTLAREVKAVTYHELAVRECAAGWEAVVIVDI